MKIRQSNIELLRLLAMFFVLVIHADFWALDVPTYSDLETDATSTIGRLLFAAFSVVGVDTFVLISGWFGIRPSMKSTCKFIFQVYFFLIIFLLVSFFFVDITLREAVSYLLLNNDYWFAKSYIGLLLVAPLLNAFVEKASKKQLETFLICFYAFQTILGWFSYGAVYIVYNGFSVFSFMGLYILARYVRLYPSVYTSISRNKCLAVYVFINIFLTTVSTLFLLFDLPDYWVAKIASSHVNPFTILASLYLLLCFSKLRIQSKIINRIAVSVFAVYLLHQNSFILNEYRSLMARLYQEFDGLNYLLVISLTLLLVFILAILIDQVRIFLWKFIEKWIQTINVKHKVSQ